MNNLIGSIIELESGERGKVAIKLKDNEYALKYGDDAKSLKFVAEWFEENKENFESKLKSIIKYPPQYDEDVTDG